MRELIPQIVTHFYQLAMNDILIGYHFDKFKNDEVFKHHLIRLTAFWEMQLFGRTDIVLDHGFRLLFTHYQLPLKRGELGRWIILFHQTLDTFELNLKDEEFSKFSLLWKNRISLFEQKFLMAPNLFKAQ